MQEAKRAGSGSLLLASLVLPLALPMVMIAQPARAEVVAKSENGFVIRVVAEVTAKSADAWKTMTSPAQWWSSQHTFSGDAANLALDPVPGGCFCETLPRPEGAPATQKPGGVQHMRVIYVEPPRALRLVGALGPLQSEALAATMTMTIKPTDKGSRILFEYVAGGYMRYKVDEIAPAVDRMLTGQITSLAGKLGPVEETPPAAPAPKADTPAGPPAADTELPPASGAPKAIGPLSGVEDYRLPPARGAAAAEAPKSAAKIAVAKPVAQAAMKPPTKSAPNPASKPAAKLASKAAAKPGAKPAAKTPNPDDDAHRDANAAFDAALGAAPAP